MVLDPSPPPLLVDISFTRDSTHTHTRAHFLHNWQYSYARNTHLTVLIEWKCVWVLSDVYYNWQYSYSYAHSCTFPSQLTVLIRIFIQHSSRGLDAVLPDFELRVSYVWKKNYSAYNMLYRQSNAHIEHENMYDFSKFVIIQMHICRKPRTHVLPTLCVVKDNAYEYCQMWMKTLVSHFWVLLSVGVHFHSHLTVLICIFFFWKKYLWNAYEDYKCGSRIRCHSFICVTWLVDIGET